ncbi:MAG: hypothetical protein R2715_11045 [Ilumatobacteraceae bacterium]
MIHPWQRSTSDEITVEVPVLEHRQVRSSSGRPNYGPWCSP